MLVLREWKLPIALTAPEPNTRRELLHAIDTTKQDLHGKRVAVQEYDVSNPELIEGLCERGAHVTRVPVYRWDLPEDTGPLHAGVNEVIAGRIDVALFTTGVQTDNFFQIAEQEGKKDELKAGMKRLVSSHPIWEEHVRFREPKEVMALAKSVHGPTQWKEVAAIATKSW